MEGIAAGSTLTSGIKVSASDNSDIIAIGGAVAYGGKVGVGAAFVVNLILSEVRAKIESAVMSYGGTLDVIADASGQIIAAAGAVGASKGKVGVGGTIAVNLILSTVEAFLNNVNTLASTKNGNASVKASNDSAIYNVAGAIGYGETAGVGAAVAFNFLKPIVRAFITSSQLHIGDMANLTTDESDLTVSARMISTHLLSRSRRRRFPESCRGRSSCSERYFELERMPTSPVQAPIFWQPVISPYPPMIGPGNNVLSGNVAGAGKVAVGASIAFVLSQATVKAYVNRCHPRIQQWRYFGQCLSARRDGCAGCRRAGCRKRIRRRIRWSLVH